MEIIKNTIGICLGGGGALGLAHLGVLKVFEEYNISPYYVSGASMGAIIGVLYAHGYNSEEIVHIIEEHKIYNLKNILSPARTKLKAGLSSNQKIENLLHLYVPHNDFSHLKRPFALSVVDFRNAESQIISSGDKLIEYVLASMSIPLAFEPEEIDEHLYVDGGIMNNLPIEPLIPVCDKIIGVDVHTALPYSGTITKKNILPIAYRIMLKQMNSIRSGKCDFYITFPDLSRYEPSDFSEFRAIYRIGYKTASQYVKQHPDIKFLGNR